jgi:hypothetical protein
MELVSPPMVYLSQYIDRLYPRVAVSVRVPNRFLIFLRRSNSLARGRLVHLANTAGNYQDSRDSNSLASGLDRWRFVHSGSNLLGLHPVSGNTCHLLRL